MNSSKTTNILLVIIGVLLALLVFVFFQSYQTNKEKQITVTPQDQLGYTTPVKEVYTEPKNSIPVAPNTSITSSNTLSEVGVITNHTPSVNSSAIIPILLPIEGNILMSTIDMANGSTLPWPPVVKISSNTYSCLLGNNAMGITTERVLNNKTYCITKIAESGMGQSTVTYTYKTRLGSGTKETRFSLSYYSCSKLEDFPDRKAKCDEAQSNFDIDKIISQVL